MSRIHASLLALMLSLLAAAAALAQTQVMDRIVAVVGDEIILLSEVEARLQLASMQLQVDPEDTEAMGRLRRALLQDLVDEKLILVQARRDSIQVTGEEIDNALTVQIGQIKKQLGSEEAFQKQLTAEGLTLQDLKKRFRPQIRNQLLREKLIRQKLSNTTVSSKEVMDFYHAYRDSLPVQGESVHLRHIMMTVTPSEEKKQAALQQAKEILARARAGESFESLAKTYSQCPSAENGGDLGFFSRGEMVPEFERAAFALNPGEISDVVETMYGYHIIRCEERQGDQVHVRHILIALSTSEKDKEQLIDQMNDIRERILGGEDFTALVDEYSQDPYSREKGGDLGWYPLDQLNSQFRSVVDTLSVGNVSEPIATSSGYHLLQVVDRVNQRQITLEDDYEALEELARQHKISKILEAWLDQLRGEIYVDIRLEG
jgi:peptidyl-prolyl cis-trans isomerase SurA